MNAPLPNDELLHDLLIRRATEGLDAHETRELESLLRAVPGVPPDTFDPTVAALTAAARPAHRLPDAVRARILAAAVPRAAAAPPPAAPARSATGWWAAAACFVLAVAGWWPRIVSTPEPARSAAATTRTREALLAAPGIVTVALAPGPGGGELLTGDVVFDPATQQGFLRFRGIPANDPRLSQYQLWIADGGRSLPEPVDGGVFDVASVTGTGDVIIPFTAKLRVGAAAAFVVTVEQPGGVVVSRQERVLALGKVTEG